MYYKFWSVFFSACCFLLLFSCVIVSEDLVSANAASSVYQIQAPRVKVTAAWSFEDLAKRGQSVRELDQQTISKLGILTVKDAVNYFSDITVADSGRQLSFFMRGMPSNYTKVFVDGISLKNALATQGASYFDVLQAIPVERIEVITGAQGVLFGSEAVAGAINIITKKKGSFINTCGGNGYFQGVAGYGFNYDSGNVYFFGSRLLDQTKSAYAHTTEVDDAEYNSYGISFQQQLSTIRFNGTFLRTWANLETDTTDYMSGVPFDDPEARLDVYQEQAAVRMLLPRLGRWDFSLQYALSRTKRFVPATSLFGAEVYDGRIQDVDVRGFCSFSDCLSVISGVQKTHEYGYQDYYGLLQADQMSYAYYASVQTETPFLDMQFGKRWNYYPDKIIDTYSLGFQKNIPQWDLKLLLDYNTGYRIPSLFEKYSSYGNQDLRAESVYSDSFAVEKGWPYFDTGISFFRYQISDRIDCVSLPGSYEGHYQNVDAPVFSEGTEYYIKTKPIGYCDFFRLGYTVCNSAYQGATYLRVPNQKWDAALALSYDRYHLGLRYFRVGVRRDYPDVLMPAYQRVDLNFSYLANDALSFNFQIQNLLNAEYESVNGYTGDPRLFLVGMTWQGL